MPTIRKTFYFEGNDGIGKAAGKQLRSVRNEKRLLEKSDEELETKYSEHDMVVGKGVKKLVKSAAIRFVGMEMHIRRSNPK